jgi:hypothetical protein
MSRESKNMPKNARFRRIGGTGNCAVCQTMVCSTMLVGNVLEPRLARIEDRDSKEPAKPQRDLMNC